MAVLEKIRKRSVLLILVIGLALFAFIISDFIGGRKFAYGGSTIAEINGDDISVESFRKRVESVTSQNKYQSVMQVVNGLWENLVNSKLVSQQVELLGIGASLENAIDLIKTNAMFTSAPIFQNDKGEFDINKVLEYILDLKANNPEGYESWKQQEQDLLEFFKQQSYFNLIRSGIVATPIEGEFSYKNEANTVDFSYVSVPYTAVADTEVTISDEEIAAYLQAHKSEFEREKTRNLKFVFFEEKPSQVDEDAVSGALKKLLKTSVEYNAKTNQTDTVPGFGGVRDVKTFVNEKSDLSFQDKFLFKTDLPKEVADSIISLRPNRVFGPYKDGDTFKLTRLLETRKIADSAKASHIFVAYIGSPTSTAETKMTKEQARVYVDSLLKVVKTNPGKFSEIADLVNTDGTKGKGGDIGWQQYSTISYDNFDKSFAEFMFFKEKGSIEVVDSQMGLHIIKIDDQGSRKDAYKLGTIVRHVDPSEETSNAIYTKVTQLEADAREANLSFEEVAKKHDVQVSNATNLTEVSDFVSFLGPQRSIVQWAFSDDVKKGSVKQFSVSKGYVVVYLDEIFDKGLMSVEQAKPIVTPILQRKKKFKLLSDKYKSSSMEHIASATNTRIETANGVTAKRPFASGLFGEEAVVGTALSMNPNEVSEIIEGFLGVFKIKVLNTTKAPELPSYASYSDALTKEFSARLENNVSVALRKLAKIEDNRAKFY